MRKLLVLLTSVLFVSACADMDNMFGDGDSDNGYYGNRNYGNGYYGGGPGYGNYGGGGYYPYGNYNYPRDRIYVITPYNPCRGYAYEGYCYRDKDDYRNAVIWDQNHRNDVNWNNRRKHWCNEHDCRRSHDTLHRDGTTDAQGRPLERPVERDRSERYYPAPQQPAAKPVPYYGQPGRKQGYEDRRQHESHQPRYIPRVRSGGSDGDNGTSQFQQTYPSREHRQRPESYRSQPYQQQPSVQPDSSVQPRKQYQPSQPASGNASDQSGKSQRKHGGRAVDLGASPE